MEKDGTFTNTERRVQRIRKALETPGQAKADWEIIAALADRMGYPMEYECAEAVMEEIRAVTPSYGGITYERPKKGGRSGPARPIEHLGSAS